MIQIATDVDVSLGVLKQNYLERTIHDFGCTIKKIIISRDWVLARKNSFFVSLNEVNYYSDLTFRPMPLGLSPEEEVVASLHMDVIRKNGFTLIEDPDAVPGKRLLLKAVPFSQNITFGAEDVRELISTLADSQGECSILGSYRIDDPSSICPSRMRNMLASRACRTSIMIGDPLDRNEMQTVLRHLAGLRSPWNCPHGRPTMRHLINLASLLKSESEC